MRGCVRRTRVFCGGDLRELGAKKKNILNILLVVQKRKGWPFWGPMRVLSPVDSHLVDKGTDIQLRQ